LKYETDFPHYKSTTTFHSYDQCEASPPCFLVVFHNIRIAGARGHVRSFAVNIYSGDLVSKDVLKSIHNLLQGGDGTSMKKLVDDLDILWASKGGNVDLSK